MNETRFQETDRVKGIILEMKMKKYYHLQKKDWDSEKIWLKSIDKLDETLKTTSLDSRELAHLISELF